MPVELTGTAVGVKVEGGMLDFVTREIHVECLPGDIPQLLELDVTPLHVGQHVEARDLEPPRRRDAARGARAGHRLARPRQAEAVAAADGEGLIEAAKAEPEVAKSGKGDEEK